MKLLTLCSGIGAPEFAATRLGWDCVLNCEIDPFCNRVLQYYYPKAYHHEDIKTLTGDIINEEVTKRFGKEWRNDGTVLVAGFPCQAFSVAGKRLGAADDRYLWPEVIRIVRETKPDWFIGENVTGILSVVLPSEEIDLEKEGIEADKIDGEIVEKQWFVFERVCRDLEESGYEVIPFVIPACAVGAPHKRDRVWFIAHRTDAGFKNLRREWKDTIHAFESSSFPSSIGWFDRGNNREERYIQSNKEWDFSQSKSERSRWKFGPCENGEIRSSSNTKCGGGDEIHDQTQSRQPNGARFDGNGGERSSSNPDGDGQREWENQQDTFPECQGTPDDSIGGENGITSNTSYELLSQRLQQGYEEWYAENLRIEPSFSTPEWDKFPTTQPAIRRGNDGIFNRLSSITFPKWRSESIKALGNSMVPAILEEIFKCIEKVETVSE